MKVSVITTVWNVEEWLEKNIQAFLNQTLKDSELVLVNDCSPDNSSEIIARYDDPRIKVVNNATNVGAGMSRQIGLDNSCGEYTIFVDGDDWIEEDCLERMYDEAIKQQADMVSCKVLHHNDYGLAQMGNGESSFCMEDFNNFINNKLIKREVWEKTHYSPLRFREDINTLFRCFEFASKAIKIDYVGYHYNCRPYSLTTTPDIACKSLIYNILAIIENIEFFKDSEVKPSSRYTRAYNTMNILILYGIAKKYHSEEMSKYAKECDIIKDFMRNNNPFLIR